MAKRVFQLRSHSTAMTRVHVVAVLFVTLD